MRPLRAFGRDDVIGNRYGAKNYVISTEAKRSGETPVFVDIPLPKKLCFCL